MIGRERDIVGFLISSEISYSVFFPLKIVGRYYGISDCILVIRSYS